MRTVSLQKSFFVAAMSLGLSAMGVHAQSPIDTPERDLGGSNISVRALCTCPDTPEKPFAIVEGFVVDAEVSLAANGRSVNERQATIFDVKNASRIENGRTRIWHSSNTKKCGVTFDYGKKYKVALRKSKSGQLETDKCLMRQLQKKPASESSANSE